MGNNRLEEYFKEGIPEGISPEGIKQLEFLMQKVVSIAGELYDLLAPGMTMEINLPLKKKIISLSEKPEVRKLLLTRPKMYLKVDATKE